VIVFLESERAAYTEDEWSIYIPRAWKWGHQRRKLDIFHSSRFFAAGMGSKLATTTPSMKAKAYPDNKPAICVCVGGLRRRTLGGGDDFCARASAGSPSKLSAFLVLHHAIIPFSLGLLESPPMRSARSFLAAQSMSWER